MEEYVLNSDEEEIKRFSKLSGEWWKENGAFAPLHRITPIRIEFILKAVNEGQKFSIAEERPLKNFNIIDVGSSSTWMPKNYIIIWSCHPAYCAE